MRKPHGLGAIQSPPDDRDFPIEQLYALTGTEKAIVIPAVYYAPNETYAPLNQGTTPQCVAYSTGALKLCEDGMWPLDTGLFFTRIGGGPNGAVTRNAFDQMLKVGYPPDEANHMISAYFAVPVVQAEIQPAIMAFGPVVLSTAWYNSWDNPVAGVLPKPDFIRGYHAILAFGWDSLGLRLRNSWGTRWGNGGDCYLPWAYLSSAVSEVWKAVDTIPPPAPEPTPTPEYIPMPGTTFTPVANSAASRLLDTRSGNGLVGEFGSHAARRLQVTGRAGVPAGAIAIAGNLTVTGQTSAGHFGAGPVSQDDPTNSCLNFPADGNWGNGIVVGLAADGTFAITYVGYAPPATCDVVFDVTGYFTP
jgi:Papain family cysteine protease